MMRVQEFVDTHAPYLQVDATLQDAVDKLDLYKATALPVLDEEGAVAGLITEQQVFDALFAEWRVASQQVPAPSLAPFRAYAHARKDAPVAPRPEFVLRAKEELMRLPAARPSPSWALLAGALALLSVTVALFYLRRRSS